MHLTEWELRELLGALSLELGERTNAMNTHELSALLVPRARAHALELGREPPDESAVHALVNRWLSEAALAGAMALFEEEEARGEG